MIRRESERVNDGGVGDGVVVLYRFIRPRPATVTVTVTALQSHVPQQTNNQKNRPAEKKEESHFLISFLVLIVGPFRLDMM